MVYSALLFDNKLPNVLLTWNIAVRQYRGIQVISEFLRTFTMSVK